MKYFVSELQRNRETRPVVWDEGHGGSRSKVPVPSRGRVLVLAPHPDDPECVAVTCRLFMQSGCDIAYTIVTMSPLGVEDGYAQRRDDDDGLSPKEKKIEIRRGEQIRSAEVFGLPRESLLFLGLRGEEEGARLDTSGNRRKIFEHLESVAPDVVMLPVGRDTNRTHAWLFQVFRECAAEIARKTNRPMVGLYNEDPKTTEIRPDLIVLYGEERARWKGTLLKMHDSQEQRNLRSRGIGFAERILEMNRRAYRRHLESFEEEERSNRYAEIFEMELFESCPSRPR